MIGKFPASKAIIDAMLEIPAIKTLNASACGEGDAPIDIINATGFFGLLAKKLPGNARKFDHAAGAAVHPNMVCVEFVLTSSLLAGARARLECLKHVLPALVACVW